MMATNANAAVTRVVYVKLSQLKRLRGRFLRPSPSEARAAEPAAPSSASTLMRSTAPEAPVASDGRSKAVVRCSPCCPTSDYCVALVGSSKRYPTPCTVCSHFGLRGLSPIFARRFFTWLSMVRS